MRLAGISTASAKIPCHALVARKPRADLARHARHYGLARSSRLRLDLFGGLSQRPQDAAAARTAWSIHLGCAVDIDPEHTQLTCTARRRVSTIRNSIVLVVCYDEGAIGLGASATMMDAFPVRQL